MEIAKDKVVSIDYTLTDESGEILDSSKGHAPLSYIQGHGNIIPGQIFRPASAASHPVMEGNILQTLSRTLHEEIAFDRQRVTSLDWASYPILTFPEAPPIELDLIQRLAEPPLGAGEAASTPVPAALANAVFDATGVRLRTVPFRPDRVKAALAERLG